MRNQSSNVPPNKGLLSDKEVTLCNKIAKLDIKLVSQRAQALLAIHQGHTQAAAATESGLSIGQVRYLMIIFKKNGIQLFPAQVLESAVRETTVSTTEEKVKPSKKTIKKKKPEKSKKKKKKTDKKKPAKGKKKDKQKDKKKQKKKK